LYQVIRLSSSKNVNKYLFQKALPVPDQRRRRRHRIEDKLFRRKQAGQHPLTGQRAPPISGGT